MDRIMTDSERAMREALDSLLAFRHGNTKYLTQEHARILYAALHAAPAASGQCRYPACDLASDQCRTCDL
jgi:hypothetical protein